MICVVPIQGRERHRYYSPCFSSIEGSCDSVGSFVTQPFPHTFSPSFLPFLQLLTSLSLSLSQTLQEHNWKANECSPRPTGRRPPRRHLVRTRDRTRIHVGLGASLTIRPRFSSLSSKLACYIAVRPRGNNGSPLGKDLGVSGMRYCSVRVSI